MKMAKCRRPHSAVLHGYLGAKNRTSVVTPPFLQRANASFVGGVSQVNSQNLLDSIPSRLGCILLHYPRDGGGALEDFVIFRDFVVWRNLQGERGDRGECSNIPADFVIPSDLVIVSDFVISSDFVIPTAASPAAFGVGAHSAGPSDFVIFQKYVMIFHEKVSGSE